MSRLVRQRTSVSALMGVRVLDASGTVRGRITEFAVAPLDDATQVQSLILRRAGLGRRAGFSFVSIALLSRTASGQLQMVEGASPSKLTGEENYLLLERDLLDQQIIDVHGHKVVRVNDVDLVWECDEQNDAILTLRIAEVEVGTRGALRRLLKGLPAPFVEELASKVKASVIPWAFVDLIDRDPSRRVRLKIEQEQLSKMHPSDIADILEDLAPTERHALFSSLDEEIAAEALEEVESKTRKTLIESLDSERMAGILEEMDPGAAADLLSGLSEERSDEILGEMNEKERQEIEELLDYAPDSAAGLMTNEYVAIVATATVREAQAVLQSFEGDLDTVTEVFLTTEDGELAGMISLARLMLAPPDEMLAVLQEGRVVSSDVGTNGRKVAELFDKYNLRSLPVLDDQKQLAGVIHAEHVIAWLRSNH